MDPPGITRHRRPFLAPLWLGLLTLGVVGGAALLAYRTAGTTVVLLVPPAEMETGTIDDPPLSAEGEQRAQRLAQMLADARGSTPLEAIFVTDERRAQQTAAPLALRLHRAPVVFSAGAARATASRLLREHPAGTVLVIGSGVALAQIIRELDGVEVDPAAGDSDTLYVLAVPRFGRGRLLRIRF